MPRYTEGYKYILVTVDEVKNYLTCVPVHFAW